MRVIATQPMTFAMKSHLTGQQLFDQIHPGEVLEVVTPTDEQTSRFRRERRDTWRPNLFVSWKGKTRVVPQDSVRPADDLSPEEKKELDYELMVGGLSPRLGGAA